jgi:hypothetical protein
MNSENLLSPVLGLRIAVDEVGRDERAGRPALLPLQPLPPGADLDSGLGNASVIFCR